MGACERASKPAGATYGVLPLRLLHFAQETELLRCEVCDLLYGCVVKGSRLRAASGAGGRDPSKGWRERNGPVSHMRL